MVPRLRNRKIHRAHEHGGWSIEAVLPALCPDLSYDDWTKSKMKMAQLAYQKAISPETTPEEKQEIERHLLEYCKLDTSAMVRMWEVFAGTK